MANFVLDKGYNLDNSGAALSIYRFVKVTTQNKCTPATAITDKCLGVTQDRIDAADSATGNAQVNVRMLGITKIEAAGAIALMDSVGPSTNGRAQVAVATQYRHGIALEAATAAGQMIDVLLTPPAGPVVP